MSMNPLQERYDNARQHCVLFHLEDRAIVQLNGRDVRDFLNRISTADIRGLKPGNAIQTLFLNKDGRLQADCILLNHDDLYWSLITQRDSVSPLMEHLDRFLFSESVTISSPTKAYYVAMIAGSRSQDFMNQLLESSDFSNDPDVTITTLELAPSAQRGIMLLPRERFQNSQESIYEILHSMEGVIGDHNLYESIRIEDGVPDSNAELSTKTIPLESGQRAAISFTKGCYPGQEIIARIYNLGHPARILVWVTSDAPLDDLIGNELQGEGVAAGVLFSTAYSPAKRTFLSLAMVKWKYRLPGTRLSIGQHDVEVVGSTDTKFAAT